LTKANSLKDACIIKFLTNVVVSQQNKLVCF
jgi:hypothetical protein